jgi:peptidyl-prolyl cis-trans isomerase SurA
MPELHRRSLGPTCRLPVVLAGIAALNLAACQSRPESVAALPPVSADVWAVVDGHEVLRADVERAFRQLGDGQTLSQEEALTAKLGLLEDLITEEILLARARQLQIEPTESEIDKAFVEARGGLADEAFQQELTKRNLTASEMREGLRRRLISQKLLDREIGSRISITEQQVTDFFNANRAEFNLSEDAFRLAQIIVTPVRDPQIANRTGDDAGTPEAAAAKVSMLMERLKGGASFMDLARDYSEDPDSAPLGGDLGLVPLSAVKQAPPALRDAVLQVPAGSARVVTEDGLHTIVFVAAREAAGQRDLSMPAVRQSITDTLRGRQEQLWRTAYITAARTDAEVVNYLARRVVEAQGVPASAPTP